MKQRTSPSLPVRLGAEALGTLLLVTAVVGSGIMAERSTNDAALALLANTLATAAILVVLVTIFAPVSGAHLNPAVSLVFAIRHELPATVFALYVVAQFLGGIAGTVLAHLMFDISPLVAGIRARTGVAQWLAESVATFSLVIAILGGLRFRPESVPWLVGLVIASAYWFTASTSFANPAVTFARAFTPTFSGIAVGDVPAFVAAQAAGALAAAGVSMILFARAR
jgi:glycerol uptake facilitator-like aquaporin